MSSFLVTDNKPGLCRVEVWVVQLSEIPPNIYLSPAFLFSWWDAVVQRNGSKVALEDKSPDYSRAREMWVSAIFACCKRISSGEEHWVKPVYDTAPDMSPST